ncbi:FAD-binding oxidoreductase [Zooshikella marina]|uniref:FAD-binding oxidoreductase n=1 Tax=Zooshikella ganghwensis TaxID=202772 RepID=UPI001BAF2C93|nr:FAD-binding oxidoreductase [Zooshikella ganghwensis]MBU2706802.1 FAD-binding oxidoreductase [Zooshikella ganghwensis]
MCIKLSALLLVIFYTFCHGNQAATWDDISHLNRTTVTKIIHVKSEHDVAEALKFANTHKLKVVISGTRHSQGGHITYPNALVLDMSHFNQITDFSPKERTITVQSGTTWDDIQQKVNPHGLSVKVMQSSNIFSIGGSISANVHGRDPNYGPLIETINKLRIMLANGETMVISKHSSPELFSSIIGGYGSLAVVLEAELSLTHNTLLEKSVTQIDYSAYWPLLQKTLNDNNIALHYGRCSFVKGKTFLKECYAINYALTNNAPMTNELNHEKNITRNKYLFDLSRHSSSGKKLRWHLQKKIVDVPSQKTHISRNNAMRPPIKFLAYHSPNDSDILQEYFIPTTHFIDFMDDIRQELTSQHVNLLSMTLRYLKKNQETTLNYANNNMIAIVLFINIETNEEGLLKAQAWTQQLVTLAQKYHGTYYLTYQRFPTKKQFTSIYPGWKHFKALKEQYDPNKIFYSQFYDHYIE